MNLALMMLNDLLRWVPRLTERRRGREPIIWKAMPGTRIAVDAGLSCVAREASLLDVFE